MEDSYSNNWTDNIDCNSNMGNSTRSQCSNELSGHAIFQRTFKNNG